MSDWYYKQKDSTVGPVSRDELEFLLASGRITSATPVRHGTKGNWSTGNRRPKRSGQKDSPIDDAPSQLANHAADLAVLEEDSSPAPEQVDSPKYDPTRRQILIAGALATILLILVAVFWNQLPTSGSSDSDNDAMAAAKSADSTSGKTPEQSGGENSGQSTDSPGTPDKQPSASLSTDEASKLSSSTNSTSNVAAEPSQLNVAVPVESGTDKPDLSSDTESGEVGVVAGDPTSKFTISAPGEATFFGLKAKGRRFTFVVDRSGSMAGSRLVKAKRELASCVKHLPASIEVRIIFFDFLTISNPGGYQTLSPQNQQQLLDWVNDVEPGSGTAVKAGIAEAFMEESPGGIFLLTDGECETDAAMFIRQHNSLKKSQINTIALESRAGETLLRQIARENNGDYKYVP